MNFFFPEILKRGGVGEEKERVRAKKKKREREKAAGNEAVTRRSSLRAPLDELPAAGSSDSPSKCDKFGITCVLAAISLI